MIEDGLGAQECELEEPILRATLAEFPYQPDRHNNRHYVDFGRKITLAESPSRLDRHNLEGAPNPAHKPPYLAIGGGLLGAHAIPKMVWRERVISSFHCSSRPGRCLPSLVVAPPFTASNHFQSPLTMASMTPQTPRRILSFWSQISHLVAPTDPAPLEQTTTAKASTSPNMPAKRWQSL